MYPFLFILPPLIGPGGSTTGLLISRLWAGCLGIWVSRDFRACSDIARLAIIVPKVVKGASSATHHGWSCYSCIFVHGVKPKLSGGEKKKKMPRDDRWQWRGMRPSQGWPSRAAVALGQVRLEI